MHDLVLKWALGPKRSPRLQERRNSMTPKYFIRKLGAVVVTMLLYGGTSHAQGVADAARESRAKQQSETSHRVFTNKDAPGAIPPEVRPPSTAEPARKAAAKARHEIAYDPYEG